MTNVAKCITCFAVFVACAALTGLIQAGPHGDTWLTPTLIVVGLGAFVLGTIFFFKIKPKERP